MRQDNIVRNCRAIVGLALVVLGSFSASAVECLPGTAVLDLPDGTKPAALIPEQLDQVNDYFLGKIDESRAIREQAWNPDFASTQAYETSISPHLANCRAMLGLSETTSSVDQATHHVLGQSTGCRIERIEVPTTEGVTARGLFFTPNSGQANPTVVVCPDADTWPEQLSGVLEGTSPPDWLTDLIARGANVYIPQSVERLSDHSYCSKIGKDRRHTLYRLGYVVGDTPVGMDVGDVSTALDYLSTRADVDASRIGLLGTGQGGMTSLYTAAVDSRISALAVGDYYQAREGTWQEPVDRRLRGQLLELGDGEVTGLFAARTSLDVVNSANSGIAADNIVPELQRTASFYSGLNRSAELGVVLDTGGVDALTKSASLVAGRLGLPESQTTPTWPTVSVSADLAKQYRDSHFEERLQTVRDEVNQSEANRYARWGILDHTPQEFFDTIQPAMLAEYRNLMGEVSTDGTPLNARSKLILSTSKYKEYQLMLDVTEGVEVLCHVLVPENLQGNAPAVIAQHGFSGKPDMITGYEMTEDTPYHELGRHLAEEGYVVVAPLMMHQAPADIVNNQVRKATPVDMMRHSMVVAKTERVIDFLETLPYVDSERIGYYGLSYGGYDAIWSAPLIDRLKAVVVSGNFNDWREKITHDASPSYLVHPDEDFYNWDVLNTFTHPELIMMTAPRAVCIEYGSNDGITTPAWTSDAWDQVVELRDHLGLTDDIELAQFDGVHEVRMGQSFDFLARYLHPEKPEVPRELVGRWDLTAVVEGKTPKVTGPQDGVIGGNVAIADGGPPKTYLPDGTVIECTHHFDFGGTVGDNINLGSSGDLSPGEITVVFWAKASGNHTGQVFVGKHGRNGSSWELAVGNNGNLFFRTFVGSSSVFAGSSAVDPVSASEFNDGQWHQFVGTHGDDETSLYVDGELVETLAQAGNINDADGLTDLLLGQRAYSGVEVPYDGVLGGPLLIFNYAMNAEEVAMLLSGPETIPGDLDADGFVGSGDLDIVRANWGQTVPAGDLSLGDASGDGTVGSPDLDIVRANWGNSLPSSVPEPAVGQFGALVVLYFVFVRPFGGGRLPDFFTSNSFRLR